MSNIKKVITINILSTVGRGVAFEVLDSLAASNIHFRECHEDAPRKEGEYARNLFVSWQGAAAVDAPRLAGGLAASAWLHKTHIGSGEDTNRALIFAFPWYLANHALSLEAHANSLSLAANALGPLEVEGGDGAAEAADGDKVTNIHGRRFLLFVLSHRAFSLFQGLKNRK